MLLLHAEHQWLTVGGFSILKAWMVDYNPEGKGKISTTTLSSSFVTTLAINTCIIIHSDMHYLYYTHLLG